MAGWAAHNEREPDRSSAYRQQAWQHLERLRRYAEFGDRAHLPWANQIADEVDGLWPPQPTALARGRTLSASVMQPLSLLHDWIVHAADRWAPGTGPNPSRVAGKHWSCTSRRAAISPTGPLRWLIR
jgi:hypothetical protein